MKVDRIKATVRYSKELEGTGAWKSVEIGAEATVEEPEQWKGALAQLYAELGREMKQLWVSSPKKVQETPMMEVEASNEPELLTTPAGVSRARR